MKKMIAIALVLMLCISALSISAFAADTVKVTAEVPADWTTVNCYSWVDGIGNSNWPGVKMTKSGNVWTAEIPADCNRVIINNGTVQTVDLTIEPGKDVKIVLGAQSGGKYTASVNGVEPEAPVSDGYYVTGSSVIFGEWAEKNASGKMTESNGIFVKEFKNVTPGNYSIKVNDGTWNNSWGGNGENGNYDFSLTEKSNVTIKFNPADFTVIVEINGKNAAGDEPVNPPAPPAPPATFDAFFVAGTGALCNGKEWDPAAAENAMTKGEDGIWTITYTNVPAGEYEVKVTAGSWDNNWGANGAANGDNVKFTIEEAGDITVKFNPATNWISVYHGDNPLTNDVSLAGIGIALLAATAGVVALVGKKKEF